MGGPLRPEDIVTIRVLQEKGMPGRAIAGRGRDGPSPEGSGRPPHRSQRAGLPHWALTSGSNVEPLLGPRMRDASWRKPAPHVPVHTPPVQTVPLAPPS